MTIERLLGELAALGAGWVLWALLASCMMVLAISVERAICFYTTRDDIQSLSAQLGRLVLARQWRKAEKLLSESPSFEARVALAAVGQDNPDSADQLMLEARGAARLELEKSLRVLGAVGNLAPFVGLLGTVLHIIGVFRRLEGLDASSDALPSELGAALIATAAGVLVALPALAALDLFRGLVEARLARADGLRRQVLAQLHAQREV